MSPERKCQSREQTVAKKQLKSFIRQKNDENKLLRKQVKQLKVQLSESKNKENSQNLSNKQSNISLKSKNATQIEYQQRNVFNQLKKRLNQVSHLGRQLKSMKIFENPNLQQELEDLQATLQNCLSSINTASVNEIRLNKMQAIQSETNKKLQIARLNEKRDRDQITGLQYTKKVIYGIVKSDKNMLSEMRYRLKLLEKKNMKLEAKLKQQQLRIELILDSELTGYDSNKLQKSLVELIKESEYFKRQIINKNHKIQKLKSEINKRNIQINTLKKKMKKIQKR